MNPQSILELLIFDPAVAGRPDMWVRYVIQLLLLLGSAFFSGSETAMFSLSHVDLQQLRRSRHKHAATLQSLLDEPRRLIVSILCGNELVNVAAVANMTGILVALYGEAKAGWIVVIVMLPLLLLFGEVTPKTIAVTDPRRVAANLVAAPLSRWVRIVAPIRWLVQRISDHITTWIVGPQRAAEHILQIDEFRSVIEDYADSGKLAASARILINNLLSAGATEIVKVMTPRTATVFLDADQGADELLGSFREARHSRVPVYRHHRDHLIGFLHAEDVMSMTDAHSNGELPKVEDLVRPPIFVPLTKTVDEMFDFFVKNNSRAAVVLNEFGGVAGFITINDVLRFIFGPLTQKAAVATRIIQTAPGTYEMPGDTKLAEFNHVTNFGAQDPRMTTIAGIAFRHIDRLPRVGDQVAIDGMIMTVLEMDAHRIARIRVARGENPKAEGFRAESSETVSQIARQSQSRVPSPNRTTPESEGRTDL